MTRRALVFFAARTSLSASSFWLDIPWLSGVVVSQANGAVAEGAAPVAAGAGI
jgi:hypothetical protein